MTTPLTPVDGASPNFVREHFTSADLTSKFPNFSFNILGLQLDVRIIIHEPHYDVLAMQPHCCDVTCVLQLSEQSYCTLDPVGRVESSL